MSAPRLTLLPFQPADCDRLIAWIPDAAFLLQWAGPQYAFPLTPDQLLATLARAREVPPRLHVFKARDDATGAIVGHIELMNVDRVAGRGHIGRVLIGDPAARGRDHGRALVEALLRFAGEELGLRTLTLAVFSFNTSAVACYTRLGFRTFDVTTRPAPDGGEWELQLMRLALAPGVGPKECSA